MEQYGNLSGRSGIRAYRIGPDHISVEFTNGGIYTYSYHKAGKVHVDRMKVLAKKGAGLNTYLNKHVKDLCD